MQPMVLRNAPSSGSANVCPTWQAVDFTAAHSGFDGITPDQHSLLGAAGPDGFYLDCGHSGMGFKTAPAVGLCMSEFILDGARKRWTSPPSHPVALRKEI